MALTKVDKSVSSTPGIVDNSDATAITIDSSERVGIGTTNPPSKLTVSGSDGGKGIELQVSTGSVQYLMAYDRSANDYIDLQIDAENLRFGTNTGAERMRINSSGHLLIGTTSAVADSRLRVVSSGSSASEYTCEMGSADGTTQLLIRSDGAFFTGTDSNSPFNSAGASANVQVLSNGALTRVSSSRRYKQDITDATWGLDEVKQLRPVTFRSNRTDELSDPNVHGGFIAEEVHDIGGLTSFIGYDENNEAETLHYGNMVSLLTKAIQEQQAIIEDLQTQINEVKNGN